MKTLMTVLSLLTISSTVFAASDNCTRKLEGLLHKQYELGRLEEAALNRKIKGDERVSESLFKIVQNLRLEVETQKEDLKNECLN